MRHISATYTILRMTDNKDKHFSYADAGVSIEHGNELVDRIKKATAATRRPGVQGNLGGFGAMFDIGALGYKHPVLVSGTDGVGTKIKLAIEANEHDTIGIDLVAMCVNDLIVQGADPLFFLDYFASSRLDVDVAERVINGIAEGCKLAGCSLVGGETAEMPGMYADGDYDLAGFCVGAVEKEEIIDGSRVEHGDMLIALPSSGCHSNGYSLVRKIIKDTNQDLQMGIDGRTLIECLLEPTRIYVQTVLSLSKKVRLKAVAHITGGGLTENIPRVIPDGNDINIDLSSWTLSPLFEWLQESGNVEQHEMLKTFNCGVGLVLCVSAEDADKTVQLLQELNESAWKIGQIVNNGNKSASVNYI